MSRSAAATVSPGGRSGSPAAARTGWPSSTPPTSPSEPRTFRVLITEGTPDTDGEHITLSGVIDDPTVYAVTETGVTPLPSTPDVFSGAIPVITTLSAQIYQRGATLVLQAGWQPAKGAVSYRADISYDSGQTWVRAYDGDSTTFEAMVGGAAIANCGSAASPRPTSLAPSRSSTSTRRRSSSTMRSSS